MQASGMASRKEIAAFEVLNSRFARAFVPGTPEYKIRKSYPGGGVARCQDRECLNCEGEPGITTYWLCEVNFGILFLGCLFLANTVFQ